MPGFTPAPIDKLRLNVGACMDVPTGRSVRGLFGEYILNAGTAIITGVVGRGNNFKSTIADYFMARILAIVKQAKGVDYDTEDNKQADRLQDIFTTVVMELMQEAPEYRTDEVIEQVFETGRWMITGTGQHLGDEYFDKQKDWLALKIKNAAKLRLESPIVERDKLTRMQVITPTCGAIDSFSRMVFKDNVKMQDENAIGDAGGSTLFMRQGLNKKRVITEIQTIANMAYHYMTFTAHVGEKIEIDKYKPTPQDLQHMKGLVLKGVPKDFTYLTLNCWHAFGASVFNNKSTDAPEYPRDAAENQAKGSADLNRVGIRQLRGKSGQSGFVIELIISQTEGLLPSLTEFHYVKERGRFGLTDGNQHYSYVLYPEETISRTTVRGKLAKSYLLRRVANITAELCQMREFWPDSSRYWMSPEDLYERIKALGYDWTRLLTTRGWYCLPNETKELPFLSTHDLLNMARNKYVPYWMSNEELNENQRRVREDLYERLAHDAKVSVEEYKRIVNAKLKPVYGFTH